MHFNKNKQHFDINSLEMVIKFPDNSEVHMKAGQMYKELGDLNKALAHTDIALNLDKYFIVAMINQADTYSKVSFGTYFVHFMHAEYG